MLFSGNNINKSFCLNELVFYGFCAKNLRIAYSEIARSVMELLIVRLIFLYIFLSIESECEKMG